MYLKSIEAQNYRLLKNVRLNVDKSATLIVGSNNVGKTSLIDLMEKAITKEKLSFDDYPFCRREKFYQGIWDLLLKKISYEDWKQNIDLVSICFVVDYSEESDEDQLGTLTPFIIDLDDNISDAKIEVIYSLSTTEERLRTWVHEEGITLSAMSDSDDLSQENKESIRKLIKKRFRDIFEWKVRAVNPNDPEDVSIRSHKELEDLFPRLVIAAERDIDESDGKKRKPLTDILNRLLETNDDDDDDISEGKKQLRDLLETNGQHVESRANEILEQIMKKAAAFGYPRPELDLLLYARTDISLEEQVLHRTELTYRESENGEELPGSHNGLGFKNLLKMMFVLTEFVVKLKNVKIGAIPLLCLEEPESHMHPQLQQIFVQHLKSFLDDAKLNNLQVLMTTHSSHIVNAVKFDQVRYVQRKKHEVNYQDLSDFSKEHPTNADFIHKYLTISRCDLFFADKAILVEGAAERLLLRDMIRRCCEEGKFDEFDSSRKKAESKRCINLASQYCTIIEVGGAFAHLFIPLMKFLGIPTLILTDLDSAERIHQKNGVKLKKVPVNKGTCTTNATLKFWLAQLKTYDTANMEKDNLELFLTLSDEEKTIENIHLEYQTEEQGYCARTLEDALINTNRSIYGLTTFPTEDDIENLVSKKTDFTLELLQKNYIMPSYMVKGLCWLNFATICN